MNNVNTENQRTIAVVVDNEVGVLARVVGLFSGRGYNIDSLTVSEVDCRKRLSRITIVARGTDMVLEQIKAQLGRLVPVYKVKDMTIECEQAVERELGLIKMVCEGEKRVEALRVAEIFKARILDITNNSFICEVAGDSDKINAFIKLMEPMGLVDVSRTGVVAMSRGDNPII